MDWVWWIFALFLVIFSSLVFSSTAEFYARMGFYYALMIFTTIIYFPYFLLHPKRAENMPVAAKLVRLLHRVIGIQWELRHRERIVPGKSYIIVANHQSSLDVLGMVLFWDAFSPMAGVAKKEVLMYSGIFGIVAWLGGTIYIDRGRSVESRQKLNDALALAKTKGVSVWIFPEGTRNHKGGLLPFKKGAFHMAIDAQLPVLPVVYSSYSSFYDKKRRLFKPGKMTMTVLPEIPTEGMTDADVSRLTEHVRDVMDKFIRENS